VTESDAGKSEIRDITVEDVLPHAPAAVWKALTTAELITRWLMPNDFALEVGRRFQFRSAPMGDWNGIVDCEILEVEPMRRLAYRWQGGSGAGTLDTIVTWTLTPVEAGTRLKMVHSGFRLPGNRNAYDAMSPGWGHVLQGIARVTAELA
jgi:uncharacterized protein YndB with AHSA1/START domain